MQTSKQKGSIMLVDFFLLLLLTFKISLLFLSVGRLVQITGLILCLPCGVVDLHFVSPSYFQQQNVLQSVMLTY